MSELAGCKVGIVACSGEELPEGTVSRLAALEVLGLRRPRETVTICLPLFLAGGAADRTFARIHPTITVDGCELRCAARATEMHSGKPAASLVVTEIVEELGLEQAERLAPAGRSRKTGGAGDGRAPGCAGGRNPRKERPNCGCRRGRRSGDAGEELRSPVHADRAFRSAGSSLTARPWNWWLCRSSSRSFAPPAANWQRPRREKCLRW